MIGQITGIVKIGKDIDVTIRTPSCEFQGGEVVEIKIPSKKKSDSQRKYFHTLSDAMADAMRVSKVYMKNLLLGRYGQREYEEDGSPRQIAVRRDIDMMEQALIHCIHTGYQEVYNPSTADYEMQAVWDVIRGTEDYNSREMAILIDGARQEAIDIASKIDTTDPKDRENLLKLCRA